MKHVSTIFEDKFTPDMEILGAPGHEVPIRFRDQQYEVTTQLFRG